MACLFAGFSPPSLAVSAKRAKAAMARCLVLRPAVRVNRLLTCERRVHHTNLDAGSLAGAYRPPEW
jgi:hypothetical protein